MACHISFRDVNFHASTTGVRIIVITDVPCHLFCRLTLEEPHIHKKPSYRRGLWLADDVRFCFDIFEDNEQFEPGDTLIHTFWKTDWPPCTIKYCYFWGTVAGEVCSSTSPLFTYHNDGVAPVAPTWHTMNTFNSIEPQLVTAGGDNAWLDQDASKYIPPEATGVILHLHNRDTGQARYAGCRKKGSSLNHIGVMQRKTHTWAICGVDENSIFQVWAGRSGYQDFWVMGYTGLNVHFLDTPIDYLPALADTWTDCDVGVQCPGARAGIFSLGEATVWSAKVGIRKKGSTDDRYGIGYHFWAIIGLDEAGFCQVKSDSPLPTSNAVWLTGYIDSLVETHTNAVLFSPPVWATWWGLNVSNLLMFPRWAVFEVFTTIGDRAWGLRKNNSLRDLKPWDGRHHFAFIHADHAGMVEFYKQDGSVAFYLIAELP